MSTKKIAYQPNEVENDDFLQSIKANSSPPNNKDTASTEKESNSIDTVSNTEKVLVNFKISKTQLERLRTYCLENDMTLTAGIKRAIRKMLDE